MKAVDAAALAEVAPRFLRPAADAAAAELAAGAATTGVAAITGVITTVVGITTGTASVSTSAGAGALDDAAEAAAACGERFLRDAADDEAAAADAGAGAGAAATMGVVITTGLEKVVVMGVNRIDGVITLAAAGALEAAAAAAPADLFLLPEAEDAAAAELAAGCAATMAGATTIGAAMIGLTIVGVIN